jgi:hypothetical protein
MKLTHIAVAAAAPLAIGGMLLAGTGPAMAATQASSSDVSAYYYNPSGNALGGPQGMGPFGSADASFGSSYLAKVTEKVNNANINGQTITIKGHLGPGTTGLYDQPNGGDTNPPSPTARVYFEGSGGGVSDGSPDGFEGQHWWANGVSSAVLDLNRQGVTPFMLTTKVDPANWSDWNGQPASANQALFAGAASHVRNIGLSFGGGWFFENGVAGTGGLTIDSITVTP